jgi:adenylate kinase family enzyme
MAEILVIHGTPGAGKTTHALRLQAEYPDDVDHVSVGNRLRAILTDSEESAYKQEIDRHAKVLARSEPLPHDVVNEVMFEFINKCPVAAVVLVDGYPRFVEQFDYFYRSMDQGRHILKGVMHLRASEETSIARLNSRGQRKGERDVDANFAAWRYNEYASLTLPTIVMLGQLGKLVEIDAEPQLEQVWSEFYNAAEEYFLQDRNVSSG